MDFQLSTKNKLWTFNFQLATFNSKKKMDSKEKAYRIAKEQMYDNDAFSQWLGIEIVELDAGKAVLKMLVRKEMTNGFDIAGLICNVCDINIDNLKPDLVQLHTDIFID